MVIELWMIVVGVLATLFVSWVLINLKTSRSDGTYVQTHPYRTMLSHLTPLRNTAIVYFDSFARADKLLAYVQRARARFHCDITHCMVGAAATGFADAQRMNRFMIGHRLYQRRGIWLTFSMKRQKLGREAKLAAVKMEALAGETFADLCGRINEKIGFERSAAVTYSDKEFKLLLSIPRPLLAVGVRLFRWLDGHNLLPASFILDDVMYTSMFIANLGSLQMAAGYHHLYEWGTCPVFVMLGQIEERALVEDGEVVVRRVLPIRYAFDERIDDGLNARLGIDLIKTVLEDPFTYLGCLAEDGSDAFVLSQGPSARVEGSEEPADGAASYRPPA